MKSYPTLAGYRENLSKTAFRIGGRTASTISNLPLVTIVTPVMNTSAHIHTAIASVRSQSYPLIEYIIIDGGSTDGTLQIIEENLDAVTRWCTAPDDGLYDAINKGIASATGKYIKILNADDVLESNAIALLVEALDGSDSDCVHGPMIWIDEHGHELHRRGREDRPFFLPQGFPFFHPTWLVPLQVYEAHGLYNTGFRISGDLEMYYRLIRSAVTFHYLDKVIVKFRTGGISDNFSGLSESTAIHREYDGPFRAAMILYFRRAMRLRNSVRELFKKILLRTEGRRSSGN